MEPPTAAGRIDAPRARTPLPGTHHEWVVAAALVSGLLLTLRGAERTGGVALPEPLAASATLRSWGRVVRTVLDHRTTRPAPSSSDLDVVARAGVVLGSTLAAARATGHPGPLARVLLADTAPLHLPAETVVAQLARVHGALTAGDPVVAATVWAAGAPETGEFRPAPGDRRAPEE